MYRNVYRLISRLLSVRVFAGTLYFPNQAVAGGGQVPGVTDGSEAIPGQVGEYISNSSGLVIIQTRLVPSISDNAPFDQLASLALPPGDWMVGGSINMEQQGGSPTTYVAAYLGRTTSLIQGGFEWGTDSSAWYTVRNVTAQDLAVSMGPSRINSASPFTVRLVLEVVTDGGATAVPVRVAYALWARRMR